MDNVIKDLNLKNEILWLNSTYESVNTGFKNISLTFEDILDAEKRLHRFKPFILKAFPETKINDGLIESDLISIKRTNEIIENINKNFIPGDVYLKADSHLPVSGSVKARGGIYEILYHAEKLALNHGLLSVNDDYSILLNDKFKKFFSKYSIAVGSTGNLGLSIGIIGSKFNFNVTVHMSSDAKKWKKDLLKSKNVTVIEYNDDYSKAVEQGRNQSKDDPYTYFVDDENSKILFLGYAVAALRLEKQLKQKNIIVDKFHPLFVYLPCGVGGAPGGITFGLKKVFKDNVHIFFAEPTESPCMFLGILTGKHENISVKDINLTNITDADGLAVARPSGFVGKAVGSLISGFYTATDTHLYDYLKYLYTANKIKIEPSASISLIGPTNLIRSDYINMHSLNPYKSTHIIWATGGNMVPEENFKKWLK